MNEALFAVGGAVLGALAPRVWDYFTTKPDTDRRRRHEDIAEDAASQDSAVRGFATLVGELQDQRKEDLQEFKRKLEEEREECKKEIEHMNQRFERDKGDLLRRIVELESQVGIT